MSILTPTYQSVDERGAPYYVGDGSPEGVVRSVIGGLYIQRDGGVGEQLWQKQTGNDTDTGWALFDAGSVSNIRRFQIDGWFVTDPAADSGLLSCARSMGDFYPVRQGSMTGARVTWLGTITTGAITVLFASTTRTSMYSFQLQNGTLTAVSTVAPASGNSFNAGEKLYVSYLTSVDWVGTGTLRTTMELDERFVSY